MRRLPCRWTVGSCCFFVFAASPAFAAVHYNGKALRDPFTDPTIVNVPKTDPDQMQNDYKSLHLQGILYSLENPRAIVNGNILGVGDKAIGESTVAAINKDNVVLSANGKTFILKETMRKTSDDTESKNAAIKKS